MAAEFLCAGSILRSLRALSLWADVGHHPLILSGAVGRAYLSNECRLDILVYGSICATRVGDFWGAFQRSLALATLVTLLTVVLSLLAGLAFRKRFRGAGSLLSGGGEPHRAVD